MRESRCDFANAFKFEREFVGNHHPIDVSRIVPIRSSLPTRPKLDGGSQAVPHPAALDLALLGTAAAPRATTRASSLRRGVPPATTAVPQTALRHN
jgi:hypothetical protein